MYGHNHTLTRLCRDSGGGLTLSSMESVDYTQADTSRRQKIFASCNPRPMKSEPLGEMLDAGGDPSLAEFLHT